MLLKNTTRAAMLAMAMSAGAVGIAPALAQEAEAPAAAPAPAAEYDDAKLQSFVVAFLQVDQINRTYATQLQEAEGEEAQNEVRAKASEEMVRAVEATDGITVEEYGSIIQQAQTDPDLAQRINEQIQQAVGAAGQAQGTAAEEPQPQPQPAE